MLGPGGLSVVLDLVDVVYLATFVGTIAHVVGMVTAGVVGMLIWLVRISKAPVS